MGQNPVRRYISALNRYSDVGGILGNVSTFVFLTSLSGRLVYTQTLWWLCLAVPLGLMAVFYFTLYAMHVVALVTEFEDERAFRFADAEAIFLFAIALAVVFAVIWVTIKGLGT